MFKRKRRGTPMQELGKTMGGVMAFAGMLAFCKTIGMAQAHLPDIGHGEIGIYRSAYFGGSGDLFAPFPPSHVLAVKGIGLALAIAGSLLRVRSYWAITGQKEAS